MRAGGAPWAPQLLAAALAAALLPRASGQTFSRGNVITVPTVAYISCELMPRCCLAATALSVGRAVPRSLLLPAPLPMPPPAFVQLACLLLCM